MSETDPAIVWCDSTHVHPSSGQLGLQQPFLKDVVWLLQFLKKAQFQKFKSVALTIFIDLLLCNIETQGSKKENISISDFFVGCRKII